MVRTFAAIRGGILFLAAIAMGTADDGTTHAVNKESTIAVGQMLPAFETTDDQGQSWKSTDHVGKKVVVLYFYPGDFTGGCTVQAQKYRDALTKIEQLGAEVVGVSGDEVASHQLFKETYDLQHALLSDSTGQVAQLLNVPVKAGGSVKAAGPDRKPLLDANGQRIELKRPVTLARWTLVVDRAGKIASLRSVTSAATDAEEIQKIVEGLAK